MAEKSRLAEILGVKEDEEFTIKGEQEGERATYRIHNGKRQVMNDNGDWRPRYMEEELAELINDPTLIVHKPRFTGEETAVLRWLHKHGKLKQFYKTKDGHIGTISDGIYGLAGDIADYLLKPGEEINLDELFKEDEK